MGRSPNGVYPFTIGLDGCGVVEQLGPKVDKDLYKPGETVVLFHGSLWNEYGYFAEYAVHDSRYLSIVQNGKIDINKACHLAALPCACFTAYEAVCDRLRLPIYPVERPWNFKSVKNIVVTAGSGGVGGFCLQLLKLWKQNLSKENQEKVKIIATCSGANRDFVLGLGATHAIDYTKEDVKTRVMELTENEGCDAWIENVDGQSGNVGLQCLSFAGEYVSVNGDQIDGMIKDLNGKARAAHFVLLGAAYASKFHDKIMEIRHMGDEVVKLFGEGKIVSMMSETIEFGEIKEYVHKVKERHVKGKIVAIVQEW